MRRLLVAVVAVVLVSGCSGGKKSSLLLERHARGRIGDVGLIAKGTNWQLEPILQTQVQKDVEVSVNYASAEYLKNFFQNKEVFGVFAGKNPYYPEHLVFYVKVANHGKQRILFRPEGFALVDDNGNQYSTIGIDYVTALGEAKQPVSTVTRGVIEDARPGYFGFSFPVGKMVAGKPQGPFALMKQSQLQSGYLHPGVVHDGLIAFWSPSLNSKSLKLYIADVKTDFNAKDEPQAALDFVYEFSVQNAGAQ